MREIVVNGIYKHFKGNRYGVICIADHSETGEKMVVYKALYGNYKIYVRPYEMFASKVDKEKYPDVEQEYRFELVNDNKVKKELVFPKPTKKQIFDIDVKKYNELFRYTDSNKFWSVEEFGLDWYNNPEFWIEFVNNIYPPYDATINIYTGTIGKDLVMEFFKEFKEQITYGEYYNDVNYLDYTETESEFLARFFNEENIVKFKR